MKKKIKLQRILEALSPSVEFQQFDESIAKLKSDLKETVHAKTLADVNAQIERFRKHIDITPLVSAVGNLESATDQKIERVAALLAQEIDSLKELSSEDKETYAREVPPIAGNIQSLKEELSSLSRQKDKDLAEVRSRLNGIETLAGTVDKKFAQMKEEMSRRMDDSESNEVAMVAECVDEIEKLRKELTNRINNVGGSFGGGNANRNIAIGGNTSVLSTFTDINLKPGANVTITYATNQTTKYTDVTIAATGGGSSVAGITRGINNTSASLTADATPGIDEVYVCSAGVAITLPAASLNGNLYTIKNVSASSVLVAVTGADTIDNDSNLILPTQFTSVDLISDGFSNWNIT